MDKETQNLIADAWKSFTRDLEEELDQSDVVVDFQETAKSSKDKTVLSIVGMIKDKKMISASLTVTPEGNGAKKKKKAGKNGDNKDKSG